MIFWAVRFVLLSLLLLLVLPGRLDDNDMRAAKFLTKYGGYILQVPLYVPLTLSIVSHIFSEVL